MKIIVSSTKGGDDETQERFFFDMEPLQTVLDVKKELEDRDGFSHRMQRLFLTYNDDNELESDMVLADCPLIEDTLRLIMLPEPPRVFMRCTVIVNYLDIPVKEKSELNDISHPLIELLEELPFISSVKVDTEKKQEKTLRLRVENKKVTFETNNDWYVKILEGFRRQVHKEAVKKVGEKAATEENQKIIESLMKSLIEKDRVFVDIEHRKQNGEKIFSPEALIPCVHRKCSELDDKVNRSIIKGFMGAFSDPISDTVLKEQIVNDIVNKMKIFNVKDIEEIRKDIGDTIFSPYLPILNRYDRYGGTIKGLMDCLDKFSQGQLMTEKPGETVSQKLNDLKIYLQKLADEEFERWIPKYTNKLNETSHLILYGDFRRKIDFGWSTKDIVTRNGKRWEEVKNDVKEGDQVWVWKRVVMGFQFAQVALYVGDGNLVFVATEGIQRDGLVKKDTAKNVVEDRNCFLIRCQPESQRGIVGSVKERAETCIGLKFNTPAKLCNAEAFANCIAQGIYTTDTITTQKDEFAKKLVDSSLSKKQIHNTLNKIAERLFSQGFRDQNLVALHRVSRGNIGQDSGWLAGAKRGNHGTFDESMEDPDCEGDMEF